MCLYDILRMILRMLYRRLFQWDRSQLMNWFLQQVFCYEIFVLDYRYMFLYLP